ncbi:MAG: dTMP kinase [Planctomycetes bacterium]|nr:dTMP kinase [Planctomycetota bacterium]
MPGGFFFSLDGVDGAGKSTQCRLLADWLATLGREAVLCHDPGGTDLGQELRHILLHHRGAMAMSAEALLFMASRAQLVAEVIRPAVAAGKVVLTDRFLLANVVYQGHAGGLDPAELWRVGQFATGGLEPDVTFVLDLPLEVSMARRKPSADRLESRGADYFARVRAGFLSEAERRPGRVRVIDASAPADVVQEMLRIEISKRMNQ